MEDKVLYSQLTRKMKEFYSEYFEQAPANRFDSLVSRGANAFPLLIEILEHPDSGDEVRTDALLALGKLFTKIGPTKESLHAVVNHARGLSLTGLTSERHAALFAIGNSQVASLITGFEPLLHSGNPDAINIACYVIGYARWETLSSELIEVALCKESATLGASTWALGQIGTPDCIEALVELLGDPETLPPAIDALANVSSPTLVKPLGELLNHPEKSIRLSAIVGIKSAVAAYKESILEQGVDELIPLLEHACLDPVIPIAVFAMVTLADLGQKIDPASASQALRVQVKAKPRTIGGPRSKPALLH